MIIEQNVKLGDKTTFGVGGMCKELCIPESIKEAVELYRASPDTPLLAGGSNVVINDSKQYEAVISLLKFNTEIRQIEQGEYYVGASVRNQTLINRINKDGYGGIEYLFSVPGTVGGVIFMNAGTGKQLNNNISQHIVSVDWFDGNEVITLATEDCGFSYRNSVFREKGGLILGAMMKFRPQSMEESRQLIRARLDRVHNLQDHSGKLCGTLCKVSDRNIMRIMKLLRYGTKDGIHFSSKTPNWLINSGKGDYAQFHKCIYVARLMHRIACRPFELEVEVWE